MRVTAIFLLFAVGIFCSPGNAESDGGTSEMQQPVCKNYLLPACPKIFDPVCGTDEETYSNECLLCLAMRQKRVNIKIKRRGTCIQP